MPNKNAQNNRKSFLQLLEKLQQDSWQLELLISGFVIFLLIGAYEPLIDLRLERSLLSQSIRRNYWINAPVSILYVGWIFLMMNLFLHIFLRGLWISTIGLRYVSGDIDYQSLKYSPRFAAYLRKKIGTFDRYIERLENICSIIFAFTFLVVFLIISVGMYAIMVAAFFNTLKSISIQLGIWDYTSYLSLTLGILLFFSTIIYFIDFLTLGFFKSKRWMYRWYMPIYKVMNWLTLSFIYRPIYYNLIDTKFGRWAGYLLVPYIMIGIFMFSVGFETHPFFPEKEVEDKTFLRSHYDDLRPEKSIITKASLGSPYVKNNFLELFIPYNPVREDSILSKICPEFIPTKRNRLITDIKISVDGSQINKEKEIRENNQKGYQCLTKLYRVQINDSVYQDLSYYLFTHPNRGERGLKSIIDIAHLNRGEHHINIQRQRYKTIGNVDSLYWQKGAFIPFWKE